MTDYYALLGIKPTATDAEIKKHYRILANKFHPDKNQHPEAAAKFIAITEAYDQLGDPEKRAHYDIMLKVVAERAQKEREDSFTTVVAPRVSLRQRRYNAQRKRSLQFHKTKEQNEKRISLVKESFIIIGRYIPHTIGMLIMLFLTYAAISELPNAFQKSIGIGLGTVLFGAGLIYGIYRLGKLSYHELTKDITTYSSLFRVSKKQALGYCVTASIFSLLVLFGLMLALGS